MMRLGPVADHEAPSVPFRRLRLVEAARVAAGTALFVAGLTFDRRLLVPAVVVAVVVGLGPLRRLTPPGTLRGAPGLPAVIASRGLLTFAFFGLDAFVPYAITNGRSRSTLAASLAVTVGAVSWTIATWIQQRWIGRLGEARFVRAGYLLLAPGILVVAVASLPDLAPFWLIYVGAIVAGLGMGLAYSAHSQLALRGVEERHVGSATASLQLCDNLGVALGAGVVGAILAFGDDIGRSAGVAIGVALLVPAGVAVVGVLLSARLPRTTTASVVAPADALG
jgi:hypothetical protein